MNAPQIITTPSGEELVVISRSEYDALLRQLAEAEEELDDIATLDRRRQDLTAPDLPAEVSLLLLKGHRRLAAVRIWRAIGPDALAATVGVAPEMLRDLEASAGVADPELAARLAAALDVPTAWISA